MPAALLSCAVVWLVVWRLGTAGQIVPALGQVGLWDLVLPLGLSGFNLWLSAVRWRVVLRALGSKVSVGRALYAVLATWPGAAITPSRASDLLRAVLIRDHLPLSQGFGSVIAEKIFDVQTLLLLALAGSLWSGLPAAGWVAGMGWLGFWIGFAAAPRVLPRLASKSRPQGLRRRLEEAAEPVLALRRSPRQLTRLLVLSLTGWLLSTAIILALLDATGASVEWSYVLSVWPVAVMAGALPFTLSGVGTRDATFVFLLQAVVSSEIAGGRVVAATLIYPAVTNWVLAGIGLPFAIHALYAHR